MKIVAGIDGGGTGTTLELLSSDRSKIERKYFGAFNLNSIGEQRFRQMLREIFEVIIQNGDCQVICIGAAGISNEMVSGLIRETAEITGLPAKLMLKGDHEIALFGAMSGNPGCILVAGTGSICTGINREGKVSRTGGWGHLIDDVGSAYALGRDALSAAVRAEDGRREPTILTEMILEHWSITDLKQLIAKVYETKDKSKIASLSVVVERAGQKKDPVALSILQKNARDLTELVCAVYQQLKNEELPLAISGGLLVNDTLLRKEFLSCLKEKHPRLQIKEPDMDAAAGAALWAWKSL